MIRQQRRFAFGAFFREKQNACCSNSAAFGMIAAARAAVDEEAVDEGSHNKDPIKLHQYWIFFYIKSACNKDQEWDQKEDWP